MIEEAPLYQEHKGTIKVSGATLPKGSGRCAFHYLKKGIFPIDFMVIGANANQQATKSMGIFRYMVENTPEFKNLAVAFQPFLYRTITHDGSFQQEKSATIWRTVIFEPSKQNENKDDSK